MAPCSPNDVSIPLPDGPSGLPIPGFGLPFANKFPDISPFPDGFPEDLLDLLNKLQLLIPPGALKPALNPNYGKDAFDAIMKLLDQFFPFLMLYKFFLPLLNLIICILEVICSMFNPRKLIRAMRRLFRTCIPQFLNLFPIFALIIMIISLLLLLLALIEYLLAQIIKFVKAILRNIIALQKSFADGDSNSVLAIAKKLGALLCIFQNLFVLLAFFNIVIQIIKDMLALTFSIPPCDDTDPSDLDGCCTPDVCPAIVKAPYTNKTGTLKYLNKVGIETSLTLSPLLGAFKFDIRPESWQLYDVAQLQAQQFRNIFDAFDVTSIPKPVFFPTDVVYSGATPPQQAAYTVDLRLFYNPIDWGRTGTARYIKFKSCIMTAVPTTNLVEFDNTITTINNGVASLGGGLGYEDDGVTPITGFNTDGITPIGNQATLENFLHKPDVISLAPAFAATDGYTFFNMEYTFTPNTAVLLGKNLITLGCIPDVALNRSFVNNIITGDIAIKIQALNDLAFPDPAATQQCMATAISALRSDLSISGVAQFQATTAVCLQKLKDDTNDALSSLIGIGFDPCKSTFAVDPARQFTTKSILVTANLNEKSGLSLTAGISPIVAIELAKKLKAHITFGDVTHFTYDGYQAFTANITSPVPGAGKLMVSFDNNIFCTNTMPADIDVPPTHDLQSLDYQFIYAPFGSGSTPTSEGDTDGAPARDAGDLVDAGGTS